MTMPATNDKPFWPRAAASAALFRGRSVLLVQRGTGASMGRWSLPGGKIEAGETAQQAAVREVLEETTIAARIMGLINIHDVISRGDDGGLRAHYLLAVFYGAAGEGEPAAQSDAAVARFVVLEELGGYDLTDSAARLIADGYRRFTSDSGAGI